jgi:hypothetical protein
MDAGKVTFYIDGEVVARPAVSVAGHVHIDWVSIWARS